jgi:hypothetical protein
MTTIDVDGSPSHVPVGKKEGANLRYYFDSHLPQHCVFKRRFCSFFPGYSKCHLFGNDWVINGYMIYIYIHISCKNNRGSANLKNEPPSPFFADINMSLSLHFVSRCPSGCCCFLSLLLVGEISMFCIHYLQNGICRCCIRSKWLEEFWSPFCCCIRKVQWKSYETCVFSQQSVSRSRGTSKCMAISTGGKLW